MNILLNIAHPFLTMEDFQQRAGRKLTRLIRRLAGKYPQLSKSCGKGAMLVALSVAWGMTSAARAGNHTMLEHIDAALSPCQKTGYVMEPPGGCITVEGQPFLLGEEEHAMRSFLWDGFAIFIDHEGIGNISQAFFDLADLRQTKAYTVMNEEMRADKADNVSQNEPIQSQTTLSRMVETAISIGDMQAVKDLELLLGTLEGDKEASRCRKRLTQWRMERNNRALQEFHFNGTVEQFIARGDGYM